MPCEKCRKFWAKRNREPDCAKCLPELMEENEEAFRVFDLVKRQAVFAGMSGDPVDLDLKSLQFVMQMIGVDDQPDCFFKVLKIWHHTLGLERLKREKKAAN